MRVGKSAAIGCTAFVLLLGAAVWAGEVTSVSVTPNVLTITQGGSSSFVASVDSFAGSVPSRAKNPPTVSYCAEWSIHTDGTATCNATDTIALTRGRNYTQNPITAADGYAGTVVVNVDAGVPCPALYTLTETFTSNSGSGVDFGNGLLEVARTVTVSVTCNTEVRPFQGCSHGYWKNHDAEWPAPYTVDTILGSVFAVGSFTSLGPKTLEDALKFGGGNTTLDKAQNLMKQAAAALLNAGHDGIFYALSTSDLIALVNSALASNDSNVLTTLAERLDEYNNYHGTPFCGDTKQ